MAIEDIERLKEKIEKNPNSKLFVPLAEEYKKAGMLDEAINVLTKGLELQPNYLSARVSLGKVYMEKGMLNESRAEFEKVISVIPDNLYAHKKLAEIYRQLGDIVKAEEELNTVLKLNPNDEWALSTLSSLKEKSPPVNEQREEKVIDVSAIEQVSTIQGEELSDISITEENLELSEFHAKSEEITKQEGKKTEEEIELWELPDEEITEIKEEIEEKTIEKPISEEIEEALEPSIELLEEKELVENAIEIEEITEESISLEGALEESKHVEVKEERATPGLTIADADSYIIQGQYAEAMGIYKKLLSDDPENRHILQRIEELRALLKLLGKDKEILIERLDDFLKGIKKRRDEFFGSS